ncbi:MAG: hypothetical protein R3E94_06850 [Burkholderiaceae bacterium]
MASVSYIERSALDKPKMSLRLRAATTFIALKKFHICVSVIGFPMPTGSIPDITTASAMITGVLTIQCFMISKNKPQVGLIDTAVH